MGADRVVLIDTSAWIEALRESGDIKTRNLIAALLRSGLAAMTHPVWVELYRGVRGRQELAQLQNMRRVCRWLEFDAECWEHAAEHARLCRQKGVAVPLGDVLITACARRHQTAVLARDRHFNQILRIVPHPPALVS